MVDRIRGAGGGKGGGGGTAPSESPNTLQSKAVARVIDLISEGEIVGLYTGDGAEGKDNPLKAVYFDNIPVMDSSGTLNFEGVEMFERVGLPDQDVISAFSEVESEITVNQQVEDASPVLFVVSDDDVDAIRLKMRLPALYEQNSGGSLVPATLQYKVEVQPSGGSFTEILNDTVTGKNTSPYERQTRIALGALGTFPLTFRVTRVTPDAEAASLQNDLFVNSYTEIQEVQLSYPDSALIAIRVNSELFSGRVPARSFLVRGIKVQVPSNYFPETRLYNRNVTTGAAVVDGFGNPVAQSWDGLFYTEWSDNPAWVLYDLLTNARYGLGEFIDAATQVDTFALYDIAVYCDELVDNGLGNGLLEPRYSYNGVINTREDAFDVINAITSTFRGMSYWSAGGVTAVADAPKDPRRLVTRANAVGGRFTYSGTALRAQHSAALVSYNDPVQNYKLTIEVIEDAARREQFGWRELEVVAFATTSRGQAYRLGKWVIDSEKHEAATMTFSSGAELSDLRPGDIIQVADPVKQAVRVGGRIISYTPGSPDQVELDAPTVVSIGDTLLITNVLGGIESLALVPNAVPSTTVELDGVSPVESIQINAVYIHRGPLLVPAEWRVLSMRETDEDGWEFSCLQYDATKYARIEGIRTTATVDFVDSGPDTIVRTDGGDWLVDGLLDGLSITIAGATLSANNGSFTIDTVTADTITLVTDDSVTADTDQWIDVGTTSVVLDAPPTSFLPTGPLLPPTNLTYLESIYKAGTSVNVKVDISWTRSTDPRAQLYRVETSFRKTVSDPVGPWSVLALAPSTHAEIPNIEDGLLSIRVTALINQTSATTFSSVVELTDQVILGKTAKPPNVTGLTANRGFNQVVLNWDDVDDLDLSGYLVRRGNSWDSPTVVELTTLLFASTYTALVSTADPQTYHVRAVDTLGNLSEAVTSITTTVKVLPAVTDLYGYQVEQGFRLVWDSVDVIENVQYEIRKGLAGSTWETSQLLGMVASAEFQGPLPVSATTTYTFRVKPFITLEEDGISYGAESTVDVSIFPFLSGYQVLQRTDETAWTGIAATGATGLLLNDPVASLTFADGDSISSSSAKFGAGVSLVVAKSYDAAFHVNLQVSSAGLPEGTIFELGNGTNGAMVCFDGSGDLIVRAGYFSNSFVTDLADMTSVIHRWPLFEVPGTNKLDKVGSNDLTDNGTLSIETSAQKGYVYFDGDAGTYLSGTDIAITTKSWTLLFTLYQLTALYPTSGSIIQFGSGSTLKVEINGSGYIVATVYDTGGAVTVTSIDPVDTQSGLIAITLTFDETTKTLSMYRTAAFGTTSDLQDSQVAASSLVDTPGTLLLGQGYRGSISEVWWIERVLTGTEITEKRNIASHGWVRLVIPNASIPTDVDFDLAFEFVIGDGSGYRPGKVRCFIDNTEFSATTYDNSGMVFRRWSGADAGKGGYNGARGSRFGDESGNYFDVLNGNVTLNSDLSYWAEKTIGIPLEISTGALTLTEGSTYGVYDFPFVLPSSRIGRLWAEMTTSSIAADALDIVDALGEINDATQPISDTFVGFEPQVSLWIDIDDTGTFIPFAAGTYQFTTATVRAILSRNAGELTRPSIDNLSVYFVEQAGDVTLKATTTDATQTTLTRDGLAATASNIPTLPDDFTAAFTADVNGRRSDNLAFGFYSLTGVITRGTGAASTAITTSSLTVKHEDDDTWDVAIVADTTNGGLAIKVTGVAATTISWLCDLDIRELG